MIHFRHFMASSIILLSVLLFPGICPAVTYEYDELNRLTRVEYDDGRVVAYAYDPAGNVLSREETAPGSSSSDSSLCFIAGLGRGPLMAKKMYALSLLTGLGIMGLGALISKRTQKQPTGYRPPEGKAGITPITFPPFFEKDAALHRVWFAYPKPKPLHENRSDAQMQNAAMLRQYF